jgi:MinD-like ATPase involved in chromosome partitioning or flagellar assembly
VRLVLALPAEAEERVLAAAIAARHEIVARPAGTVELAAVLAGVRPDAVIVAATPALLGASVIAAAAESSARLVVLSGGPADQLHAESLGIGQTTALDSEWQTIELLLAGSALVPAPAQRTEHRGAGRVIAVWGPTGAPGRSAVAMGIAFELAERGHRVALVDADTHGASIAPALGLLDEAPAIAAACRLAASGGLDLAQLDRISSIVPIGSGSLRVLTGLPSPARWPELSETRITDMLRVTRHWADAIVVDTGFNLERDEEIVSDLFAPRRNAATIASVAEADAVVAVGAGDPIGLARLMREHAALLESVDADRISVVINKVRPDAIGFDHRRQILDSLERFGGIEDATLIPYDLAAFDRALASARPLREAAPKSPARVAIARLAEALAPSSPTVLVEQVRPRSRFAPV